MDTPARNPFFRGFLKQTLAVVFFFLLIFLPAFILPVAAHAQSSYPSSYASPNTNPDVPRDQHTLIQTVLIDLLASTSCIVSGIDPLNLERGCLGLDSKTGKIGYVPQTGGLIGTAGNMISSLYSPPLGLADYTRNLAQNFGLVRHAYAQSIGFDGLKPLMAVWITFRNITYLLFIVVFVVIGLAVMLRIKIDPRTVMSLQNQIPKVIVSLLLITFSYAIAGFLIDLMYVTIYVEFNIASTASKDLPQSQADNLPKKIIDGRKNFNGDNPISFLNNLIGVTSFAGGTSGQISEQVRNLFSVSDLGKSAEKAKERATPRSWQDVLKAGACLTAPVACILVNSREVVSDSIRNGFTYILSGLAAIAAFLIISIAIVISLFRLWFILIRAYIYILMDVALAPIWILAGVFPASTLGFGYWIRRMLSNIAVFPAVIGLFLLARIFITAFGQQEGTPMFVAPLLGNPNANQIGYIIGLGFILIAPTLLDRLQEALKAKINTSAVSEGFKLGAAPAMMMGGGVKNMLWKKNANNEPTGILNQGLSTALNNMHSARTTGGGRGIPVISGLRNIAGNFRQGRFNPRGITTPPPEPPKKTPTTEPVAQPTTEPSNYNLRSNT